MKNKRIKKWFYQDTASAKFEAAISIFFINFFAKKSNKMCKKESLFYCWLVRGSLFIELGCPGDLGKGWRGDLGTFMISRPI